ncbi:related to COG3602 family protein [Phialocephala subalpina]|uniref:Related to COG3602 family protein n=1 Tax=Phialocephala subalpina TaxID=576137 RepID=A0A1L7X7V5_9HELO|nr:related to COG3602 family protein [Phialocephala subalpina]
MSAPASTPAPGETSLAALLSTLKLSLDPRTFVFVTLPPSELPPTSSLFVQMSFQEAEGLTIITTQESAASHGLEYTFLSKMITLNIHSSLEAVGFMAAISAQLTKHNIGANPVSGYFHDHCFVPLGKEEEAMKVLLELAEEAKMKPSHQS